MRRSTVAQVAKRSGCSTKEGELLFRLAQYLKPRNILELGTSLGLGTLYLHLGHEHAHTFTIEGSQALAAVAKQHFADFRADITTAVGPIEQELPKLLQNSLPQLDLVYFDAHHTEAATKRYFEQCLPHTHHGSVLIFDDIHWSEGMEKAWAYVSAHPAVGISIDLFDLGLAFFRQKQPKQHFILRM